MLIDTSVLVRFFTGDDKKKATRVEKFLKSRKKAEVTDAYLAAYAIQKKKKGILAYDKGFDKLPGVKRVEP